MIPRASNEASAAALLDEYVASLMPLRQRVALVSGANRGIGFETAKQLGAQGMTVLLGARDLAAGEKAARELRRSGAEVLAVQLDVTSQAQVDALAQHIDSEYRRLDVLINNAGGFYDPSSRASTMNIEAARDVLDTNLMGAWRLSEMAVPLMRRHGYGRIVNVSSGCGSMVCEGPESPAYRVSKAALNALTRAFAAELIGSGILVNAVCPGWVATRLGGRGGRAVSEGAAGIVWAALIGEPAPTGQFFRDGQSIAW